MSDDRPAGRTTAAGPYDLDTRLLDDLEHAVDTALLAPSLHANQPWLLVLHPGRLEVRVDRTRQLAAIDPHGRELVTSVGAALFNARVALAARGRSVTVERFPGPDDPDLAAVLRPGDGPPDPDLAALATAVHRCRAHRRRCTPAEAPDDLLRRATRTAAAEDTRLVPLLREEERRLIARTTQLAEALLRVDPAHRAELQQWTTSEEEDDEPDPRSAADPTLVLLASHTDHHLDWLRAGEALERVLLLLTVEGWAGSPLTPVLEVGRTRTQLRSRLCWGTHAQVLLQLGRAPEGPAVPHRPRDEVVRGSSRPAEPAQGRTPGRGRRRADRHLHAVSDGRGGTSWR